MPGVLAATTTTGLPVFGGASPTFDVPGTTHDDAWRATFHLGSAGYFKTLGIPLLQGRELSADDDLNSRRVAVVNQTFVQRHLDGANPIGRTIIVKGSFGPRFLLGGEFEIVGVVADAKNQGIQEPSAPEVVVPYGVGRALSRGIVVRTAGPPLGALEGIKREIWSVDRGVPIANAEPVTTYLAVMPTRHRGWGSQSSARSRRSDWCSWCSGSPELLRTRSPAKLTRSAFGSRSVPREGPFFA
jgi:hypothetical protein